MEEKRLFLHAEKLKIVTFFPVNVKTKNPYFREFYTCFGCKTITGVKGILVNFQDKLMFSLTILKVSATAFHCG